MKKYWIKDLDENQVIHAPTEDIAKKLHKKFNMLGLVWLSGKPYSEHSLWRVYRGETCYSPSKGLFCNLSHSTRQGYEVLTIDELLDFQANEYPKVMEVSQDRKSWDKRVVFMEKNGEFLAWGGAKTIKEAEGISDVVAWSYAREIKATLELTIDQIAEKFNVSPEQIEIKK